MNVPKLNSDQIKKVVLSGIGFIILIIVYRTFFLGPIKNSQRQTEKAIADIQHNLDTSKSEMQKATNLEKQAKDATAHFAALKALTPDGAPIAWFPPRMKAFFVDRHIDKAVARLEGTSGFKEAELASWARYNWLIDLPQTDYLALGQAIADLENAEPLLTINRLSIHSSTDQPQFQQVAIAATTVIDKK